jgi:hypothetical protein
MNAYAPPTNIVEKTPQYKIKTGKRAMINSASVKDNMLLKPQSAAGKSEASTAAPDSRLVSASQKVFNRKKTAEDEFNYQLPNENKVEIRCMLHPQIQRSWKSPLDHWFPGTMKRQKELRHIAKMDERKCGDTRLFKTKVYVYNEEDAIQARTTPVVRCASKYVDPDKKMLLERIEQDQKIINKKKGYNIVSRRVEDIGLPFYTLHKPQDVKDPKNMTFLNKGEQYRPISSYHFRDVERDQWLAGKDFILQ